MNPALEVEAAIALGDSARVHELVGGLHEADVGALLELLSHEARPRLVELMGSDFDFTALMEVGEAWKKSQSGTPRFNVFTDGSQGGEAEMVRRMRIGQLQAALLSVVGLREIEPSIAALQNLPLAFRSSGLTHLRVVNSICDICAAL